ncbi:MAG: hypothetical protein HQK69_06005 [Desulfamplus sp.]|nr:hypothetical protein [Desulfamplus sp.]
MSPSDDEVLFSQEDIDKLLNAQSLEEAEESIINSEDDAINDMPGELSQDDIDKLLNAQPLEKAEESIVNKEDDIINDIAGELSQDDIDRLLNATLVSDEPDKNSTPSSEIDDKALFEESALEEEKEDDDEDDDLGELSQDDIDRMLNSQSSDQSDTAIIKDNSEVKEEDSGAFDLISQDDIDKLMATDDMPDLESGLSSDLNLDSLGLDELDSSIASSAIEEDITEKNSISDEEIIDPSEAWDIQNCLITQETIDNLLSQNLDDTDDGEILKARKKPPSADDFKVNLSEDDQDFDVDDIASNDLDNLLNSTDTADMDDLLNEISQDDIDGFLKDSDELASDGSQNINDSDEATQGRQAAAGGGDDNVRNIISQDDIDALLAGSDEEDEDILADMEMDEDLKRNSVSVQNIASGLPEDDNAQVVLEESDEPKKTLADGTVRQLSDLMEIAEDKPKKKRSLLKIIIIILLILTLIAGSVAGLYFMFFKKKVDELLHPSQPKPKVQVEENVPVENEAPEMNIKEAQELTPGTLNIENFVIFTPQRNDGITYISLDVSIEYSHSSDFDAISNKLPYYRGVIYDAISNALKSDKGDKLTESELLEIVKNALNQALPDVKFSKIIFVNFKTG